MSHRFHISERDNGLSAFARWKHHVETASGGCNEMGPRTCSYKAPMIRPLLSFCGHPVRSEERQPSIKAPVQLWNKLRQWNAIGQR